MYTPTQAQLNSEKLLNKQGFRFNNWIAHRPYEDGEPAEGTEHLGIMVMIRHPNRFTREYREIDPNGTVI